MPCAAMHGDTFVPGPIRPPPTAQTRCRRACMSVSFVASAIETWASGTRLASVVGAMGGSSGVRSPGRRLAACPIICEAGRLPRGFPVRVVLGGSFGAAVSCECSSCAPSSCVVVSEAMSTVVWACGPACMLETAGVFSSEVSHLRFRLPDVLSLGPRLRGWVHASQRERAGSAP